MPSTDEFDQYRERFMFLTNAERVSLAYWLMQYTRPAEINRGRWQQLCDLDAGYISTREIEILNDSLPPFGMAIPIIHGECVVTEVNMS